MFAGSDIHQEEGTQDWAPLEWLSVKWTSSGVMDPWWIPWGIQTKTNSQGRIGPGSHWRCAGEAQWETHRSQDLSGCCAGSLRGRLQEWQPRSLTLQGISREFSFYQQSTCCFWSRRIWNPLNEWAGLGLSRGKEADIPLLPTVMPPPTLALSLLPFPRLYTWVCHRNRRGVLQWFSDYRFDLYQISPNISKWDSSNA